MFSTERNKSLVSKTVISKHICGKIQKAGLGYMHLLLAFKRGGFDGLQLLLGEKNEDGKVRVTRRMKVVEKIAAHFRAEFQEEWCKCELNVFWYSKANYAAYMFCTCIHLILCKNQRYVHNMWLATGII